jgi:hypothetical protein
VVPRETIQNYKDAFTRVRSLTYRVIRDADHGLTEKTWQQAYTAMLVHWLGEMVLSARTGSTAPVAMEPLATEGEQALGESD